MGTNRKRIQLRYGGSKKLAKICGVSRATVTRACGWNSDNETENYVRRMANELGLIKKF